MIFNYHIEKDFGYFMIFGRGLHWKNIKIYPLTFSERSGYEKYLKIGKWIITYLKPYGF